MRARRIPTVVREDEPSQQPKPARRPIPKAEGNLGKASSPVSLVQVSDEALVEAAYDFLYDRDSRGTRRFPTDSEIVAHLRGAYNLQAHKAVAVLRGMRARIAERVNATMPTQAQNVVAELHDEIQAARRAQDHGAAIRGLIALGRFAGLDQPQKAPEVQVRELSDVALNAAYAAALARALETMAPDKFNDLVRRREIAMAKKADGPPATDEPPPDGEPDSIIDAG